MANSVRVTIELLAKDLTKAAISGVKSGLAGISSALTTIAAAAAGAGGALLAFTRFAVLGERDIAVAERFTGAMTSLGLSADEVRKRLTDATGGLVEQNDVMRSATKALKDGKFSLDQTALAMEFLRLKAVSTGADVTDFTKNGIDALSRGMARGLLPLFPDLNRQLEELANSGMEGAHQKSETLRLVFQRMITTLPELQKQVGDTSVAAQQFGIELKNAVSETASQIAASPATKQFFTDILASVKDLIKRLPELLPTIETAIGGIARLTGQLAQLFAKAVEGWTELIAALKRTPETIEASGLAGNIARTFQVFDGINPDKSPEARKAYDDARTRIGSDLTRLWRLVTSGAKIEGLTSEQAVAIDAALEDVGASPDIGLIGRLFIGKGKTAEVIRAALAQGTRALADVPAKVAPAGAPKKLDLSNLTGDQHDTLQRVTELEQAFKTLEARLAAGDVSLEDYRDSLRALTGDLHTATDGQQLAGPALVKATELTKALGDATTQTSAAINKQVDEQEKANEALAAANVITPDYEQTTLLLGHAVTTVGAALGDVTQSVQEANDAATRADLGVGSFEAAHKAAEETKQAIQAVAQALMTAGLPADALTAALKQLADAEQNLGAGATQGLLDMKLLLTDITHDTIAGFTDAISGAFQAMVDGSQSAATAFKVGMLKAIAAVASGLAQMMVGKAVEQIAEALAHPLTAGTHLASAAKFTAAAALFGAISGALSGAASSAGGGSAGGNPNATTAAASTEKGSGTIVVQGSMLDMSDPKQADAFSKAVSDLTGRQILVMGSA